MRTRALLVLMLAAASSVASGQTTPGQIALPAVFLGAVRTVEPAGHAGAWALQVITRGGIDGRSRAVTVTSDGTVDLVGADQPTVSIHPDILVSLDEHVHRLTTHQWIASRLGTCSDCVATLIVLAVRAPSGLVQTHVAFWDVTTRGAVSIDLRRIHELTATLLP